MGEGQDKVVWDRPSVAPHLVVRGGVKALEFYAAAFGARELFRMPTPDGRLMHASMAIGDGRVMLCDEFAEQCETSTSPEALGGTPVTIHLNVDDVDATYAQAVASGATGAMPPADMFWGDRYAQVVDPFGHRWSLATPVKAPTMDELTKGVAEICAEPQPA